MSVSVKPSVPIQTMVPDVRSTSKHVLRKRQLEILPNAQVDYSYFGNNQIEFTISSGQDFIDFASSYLRCDLTCDLLLNGSDDTTKYLSEGGLHSMFREIRLETATGTVLERVDRYNKLYALMTQLTKSQEDVDRNDLVSGDSVGFESYLPERLIKDAFFDSDSGTVGAIGGIADADFRVAYSGAIGANASGDPGTSMIDPARKKVANTNTISLSMRPMMSFMNMAQWIPLFLVRGGLKLVLVLDRPVQALASTQAYTGTGFTGANAVLSNVRYIASMITPSEELTSMYVQKYNGEGITYSTLGYRHFLDLLAAGAGVQSKQLYANVRSARFILQRIQVASLETDTNSSTDVLNSYEFDSCAIGLKANLKEYQFQSGSFTFPVFKVQTDDVGNFEALVRAQQAVGVYGDQMITKRFDPWQWQEVNSIMGITDCTRFCIGEDLSRNSDILCGLDTQVVPILYELNFDANFQINSADATRYLHTWLSYDQLVSISSSGIIVRS